MKKDDYIYLFLAFILGYFTQSIIKQRCGTIIEGNDSENSENPENSENSENPENPCCTRANDPAKPGDFICQGGRPVDLGEDPAHGGPGLGAHVIMEGQVWDMTFDSKSYEAVSDCFAQYNAKKRDDPNTQYACDWCDTMAGLGKPCPSASGAELSALKKARKEFPMPDFNHLIKKRDEA